MIAVGRLAPMSQWDTTLIDALIDGKVYPHGIDVRRHDGYPNADGCVLVVPARYWWERIDAINEAVSRYRWLLFIRTSDEEDLFDIGRVVHPNARFWVQSPRADRDYGDARLFGVGHTPHFAELPADPPDKTWDVVLAAQNTHARRSECFAALEPAENRYIHATRSFTAGLPPDQYAARMCAAKIAPCPSGPASPDTFRVWESLEAHAIPIADDITPGYDSAGYWRKLFPHCPFPVLTDYECLPGYIEDLLAGWPANANRIAAAWMRQKRQYAHWLVDDLTALGALT